MKKMVFGLGLLLSGIIGFVGWCIAAVQKVQQGARSRIFGCINGEEWIVLLIFALMAVAGLVISVIELKKTDFQFTGQLPVMVTAYLHVLTLPFAASGKSHSGWVFLCRHAFSRILTLAVKGKILTKGAVKMTYFVDLKS